MTSKSLKCFVAMAFGRNDCDIIYDQHILPTLKELGVDAIRVDRREHKDDINIYLIKMLNKADIAIADLTYTRPSVYYEAGYAERKIPVIYTVREDHLNKGQADDTLRVHFDLEMKKIVTWGDVHDLTFIKRLRQRLDYFLRPLRKERDEQLKLISDRTEFTSLSVASRCEYIYKVLSKGLQSKRFYIKPLKEIYKPAANNLLARENGIVAFKQINKTCHFCFILASESITQMKIANALNWVKKTYIKVKADTGLENVGEVYDYYFFCALKNIPESRLTTTFPKASPMANSGTFTLKRSSRFTRANYTSFVYFLKEIDSKIKLKNYLTKTINPLDERKTNHYTRVKPAYSRIDFAKIVFY